MKMKHFGIMVLLFSAMAFTLTGCGMMDSGSSEKGTRMSGAEHKEVYPQGHNKSLGKNCYYDSEDDSFFCTFNEK